jgi:hypothetical protein
MAYRSFSLSGFEARGVRKVTTGYELLPVLHVMAMQYDDPFAHTERPGTSSLDLAPRDDLVNKLSREALDGLINYMRQRNKLVPCTVETGGSPPVATHRSMYAASGQAQITPPVNSLARRELSNALPDGVEWNNVNLNVHLLLWRWQHDARLVPACVEVSHLAESYHRLGLPVPFNNWSSGHKIELSELESAEMNESRKVCTRFGLMWRKPDGSLITPDEKWGGASQYVGPTMCLHSMLGSPCYGPYFDEARKPTFYTPFRQSRTQSKRVSGSKRQSGKATVATPIK